MKFLWHGSKIQIVSISEHKQTLVRKERLCIFFPQICCYFREKRTFRFHPLESMDRVITGQKLNTFARLAFQRYYVQGNLTNMSSFIERETNFSLSPSGIDGSGHNRSKIEHFRSSCISKILCLGKPNQHELFHRLFAFCKI